MTLRSVSVYCASHRETPENFRQLARDVGRAIASAHLRLVYGGASIGMMGEVADAALAAGGEVLGVIPESLKLHEVVHHNVTELLVTPDMHQRKMKMFNESDAFVALPGGVGTLEELTEIISWKNLGIHRAPIIILNHEGFFDPLITQYKRAIACGVMDAYVTSAWKVVKTSDEMMSSLIEKV